MQRKARDLGAAICTKHRVCPVVGAGGEGARWGPGARTSSLGSPPPTCTTLLAQQGLWKGGSTGQCHSRPKTGTLAALKGTAAVLALWRAALLGTEASGAWRVRTQVRMSAPPWGGLHRRSKHLTDRDHFLLPSPRVGPRPVVENLLLFPNHHHSLIPSSIITTTAATTATTTTSPPSSSSPSSPPLPPPLSSSFHHHHHCHHCSMTSM